MNEITLLSKEQVSGKQKIDVIKKMGTKCAVTDFAILLGAKVSNNYYVSDDNFLNCRTAPWYLLPVSYSVYVPSVETEGSYSWLFPCVRYGGVRPVLLFTDTLPVFENDRINDQGILEIEYGEYPQYVVDTSLGRTLDSEFSKGRLRKTGKTYTTDSRRWNAHSEKFNPVEHEEFEYNGKRYVRVKSNCCVGGYKLSNGATAYPGDYFWLEVSPIKWLVEESSKILISKKLLVSGVRFCDDWQYYGDFENTEMYKFLNEHFAREILPIGSHMEESARIIGEHTVDDEDFLEKFNAKTEQTLELLRGVQEELGVPKLPASKISEIKNENARLAAENETKRELLSILKELLELYYSQVALGGEIDEEIQALLNELSLQEAEELVNLVDSIVGLDVFSLDSDALSGGNDEKVYKIH